MSRRELLKWEISLDHGQDLLLELTMLELHLSRPQPPRLLLQLLQQDQLLTSLPSSDSSSTNSSPRSAPLSRPPSPAPTLPADKFRECLFPPVAQQLLSLLETTLSGSKLLNSTLNTRALMTEQQPNKI